MSKTHETLFSCHFFLACFKAVMILTILGAGICSFADVNSNARRPLSNPLAVESSTARAFFRDMRAPEPTLQRETVGLVKMARLSTVPQTTGLVALGACAAQKTLRGSVCHELCLTTFLTALATVNSMLINDYYDYKLKVDTRLTKPGRALVTGKVHMASVKTAVKCIYICYLFFLCLVDAPLVRLWILASTLLAHLYSTHLKRLTAVKNIACAAAVSMAMGLGALVTGGMLGLTAALREMVCVFGVICHREILMDIKDIGGDRAAQVRTLSVVFGQKRAFLMSLIPLAGALRAALGCRLPLAATVPLVTQLAVGLRALNHEFSEASLVQAIEVAPVTLLLCLCASLKK